MTELVSNYFHSNFFFFFLKKGDFEATFKIFCFVWQLSGSYIL